MLPELSARLTNALAQKRHKERLERDLEALKAELKNASSRLDSLSAQLTREKVDVEKLERTSLTALFYSVLGSREEQLEKERQELLSAQLQYQQVKHQVEALQRDRDYLRQQIGDLAGVEDQYEALLAEKEAWLRQSDQVVAGKLMEIAEQGAELASQINEISEAIQAGKGTLSSLETVLDSLEGAQRWGVWDMFGGGLLSTAVKHDRIDRARQGIQDVQERMSHFKRELADVEDEAGLNIDIGGFETFADYFFDGLIVDWVVQSKIETSLGRARDAQKALNQAVKRLQSLKQNLQSKQSDLQERRAQIIERG